MINTIDLRNTFYDPMKEFRNMVIAGKLSNTPKKLNDPRSKNKTVL
jgi:hypothetical protein